MQVVGRILILLFFQEAFFIFSQSEYRLLLLVFFSANYRSFMNPRRNEQSPDFKMRFGDSICHSFSGTQTHEDQRPEGLRSPGKN